MGFFKKLLSFFRIDKRSSDKETGSSFQSSDRDETTVDEHKIIPSVPTHTTSDQTEIKSKTQQKSPQSSDVYIGLGFDFGTYGTKLAYREIESDVWKTKIITLKKSGSHSRPRSVFPTLISVSNNKLYFGHCDAGSDQIINFKMRIGENTVDGHSGLTHEDLSILFLAYTLSECNDIINRAYPNRNCKIFTNLGVPFSVTNVPSNSLNAYHRILKVAWRLWKSTTHKVEDGITIDKALRLVQSAELEIIENEEFWRWLVPEIQGTVTTYALLNNLPRKGEYHLVVDIGGFTTDFSLFNVGSLHGEPRACIFASSVIREGVNAFNCSSDSVAFIKRLRNEIFKTIEVPFERNLLQKGMFTNFDTKHLWCLGGGSQLGTFAPVLLNSHDFLGGYKRLTRHGKCDISIQSNKNLHGISSEDLQTYFTVVLGLSTRFANLTAIIESKPLPKMVKPPEWIVSDYYMSDAG